LSGQRVLRQVNLDPNLRTAASLAPELHQTLRWCEQFDCRPHFLSIADGPGSFTGLRIGVTTAKTLSYALGLPLVAVDALASIAAATLHQNPRVESLCVATDAYRGQVFVGTFSTAELLPPVDSVPAGWTAHPPSVRVLDRSQWKSMLEGLPAETGIAGDPKPLGARADNRLERDCDAAGVGLLGIRAAAIGAFVDPLRLVPRYLRMSAAEEKAAGR
jgi:tRNA threonylcarbamoyl adenosine modification protein YeaZ